GRLQPILRSSGTPGVVSGSMSNSRLYEQDFYAWAMQQAGLLRAGRLSEADIDNLAEEIESMGRTEKRELVSRLTVLLRHLLKWRFQPTLRGNSWRNTIRVQRIALASHLRDNPSLKAMIDEALIDGYRIARIEAENETGLAEQTFPPGCPWPFHQLASEAFWPDG
ncbi:MAG: DUF29 domain-containing protein, partial [Acetobacteraceae bacterium]